MAENYKPFENHVDYIDLPENTSLSEIADLMDTKTPIKAEALTDKQKEEFNEYYYKNYQPVLNNNQPQNRLAMEDVEETHKITFHNNIDQDILDSIKNPLDKLNELTKCSRYAGTVLAKLFDKDRYKDIKLCLGNIISENSYDYSTDITHVWLVVDGHILETRFPSGNYKRVCIEELTLNKNKDLYTQVEQFINRVKNKVIPMSEALTFEKPSEYGDTLVNTLDELFAKYPGLDNPKESGVEFYQFRDTDNPNEDLLVITSSEEEPNSFTFSGFDKEDYKVGQYLLNFPYNARTMIFDDVQSIDKHLTDNKGFKLPGYTYED